ncbi:O-antigen ligase family protein [bacterium]|nr:O-antigen ligase family protein [bacterium]
MLLQKGYFNLSCMKIYAYFFILLWIGYSLLSFFWAKNPTIVLKYTYALMIKFIIFFIITQSITSIKSFKYFFYVFYFVYITYIVIAVWEFFTWDHLLPSSLTVRNVISFIPTGPFYNQNDFAWILMILSPFIFFSINFFNNFLFKIFSSLLLIITLFIFIVQSARIALMLFFVETLIYFFFFLNLKKKISIILVFIIILLFFSINYSTEYNLIKKNLTDQFASLSQEQETIRMDSMETRMLLIKYALEMTLDTYLFGVGSGNYLENMDYKRAEATSDILITHNYILELIATNGLLIGLFFIFSIYFIAIKLLRKAKKEETKNKFLFLAGGYSLIIFLPASALPSSIMLFFCHWIILSAIFSLFDISVDNSEIYLSKT